MIRSISLVRIGIDALMDMIREENLSQNSISDLGIHILLRVQVTILERMALVIVVDGITREWCDLVASKKLIDERIENLVRQTFVLYGPNPRTIPLKDTF